MKVQSSGSSSLSPFVVCRNPSVGLMSQRRGLHGGSRHRTCREYAIRSIHFSLRVCQGLGADFRRKSEIRKPALWGRKAGTDRGTATLVAAEGIPEGFHPGESGRVALKAGKRERQRRGLMLRGTSCTFSRCHRDKGRSGRPCRRFAERSEPQLVLPRD